MNNNEKTILITIASCREYYLIHTIKSALALAKYPERVYFSIFNTILDDNQSFLINGKKEDLDILTMKNVFYTEFHSPVPMGIGFSRMNAALMCNKEHDFILQIDAHTVFDKDWDETFIKNYDIAVKHAGPKVVLSNMPHPFNYKLDNREKIFWKGNIPINFYDFDSGHHISNMPSIRTNGLDGNGRVSPSLVGVAWVDGGDWNDKKIIIDDIEFHEGNCVFAATMFYSFEYVLEFLHNPKDPFSGDQIDFSLRLLSRGFRIFHFYKPVLLSLDKYSPEIDTEYQWKDPSTYSEYSSYVYPKGVQQHKDSFSGKYFGYWGAPDSISLKDAKQKMGLEGYLE